MIILERKPYKIYISENKDNTAREIPGFVYTKQVHGNNIYILDKNVEFIPSENDGIISKLSNTKIWVLLADCNGIVLMGKSWYGAIHAGRKWLKNDIITKAINILKEHDEDPLWMKVYIWPSIRQCCYQVGEEFLEYFNKKYFTKRNGKTYLDMIAVAKDTLIDAWILPENIEINEYCTSCSWKFFSYRNNNNNQRFVVAVEKNNHLII